ncbi:MAG: hypothetical protein K2J15_01075, partial [Muribaculaceae bacterium]|nr:hypothetical protein [Muribaculaceae bacterium]
MKLSFKIIYTALLWILLLTTGCSDEIVPVGGTGSGQEAVIEGEEMTIYGSIGVPALKEVDTRSLTATLSLPDMHLYLVEFTNQGDPLVNTYIRTYQAEEETVVGDVIKFKLTVLATTQPRILHLIALPKSETLTVKYG